MATPAWAANNLQWCLPASTPTVLSVTSADTDFPKERMVDLVHIWRPWHSTSLAQQDLIFDLGLVPYGNAMANPNFATDLSSWTVSSGVTRETSDVPAGYAAAADLNDASASTLESLYQDYFTGSDLDGKVFQLQMQTRLVSGAATSYLAIQWFDQSGVQIGANISAAITSATWGAQAISGTAPAGTYRVRGLVATTAVDTSRVRVTGIVLRIALQAVVPLGANFPQAQLAISDDNSNYSDLTNSPFSLALDLNDKRRKTNTQQQFYARYLRHRIPANHIPDKNVAYYSLGALAVTDRIKTFTYNPYTKPFRITQQQAQYQNEVGGNLEIFKTSGPYIIQEWQGDFPVAQLDEWRAIGILGGETMFLEFVNAGLAQEVYPMRYLDTLDMVFNDVSYTATFRMRELAGFPP